MTIAPQARNRVRELRMKLGLTQAGLAALTGVSRPSVTAIEMGRITPSVTAALALAGALQSTVEELFATGVDRSPQWAWEPPAASWRAWHAEIGGAPWYIPVEGLPSLTTPHDLVVDDDSGPFDWRVARSTLVVASCDPAAVQMAMEYHRLTGMRMLIVRRSSRQALQLLHEGKVHAAGLHLGAHGGRHGNAQVAREVLGAGFEMVRAATWQAGVTTSDRFHGTSLKRLAGAGVRWVGREAGSGARQCLDEVLGAGRVYRHVARDHGGVVEAVRCGWADAGVCVQLASVEAGLPFRSVRKEDYDLCFPECMAEDPRMQGLVQLLQSHRYRGLVDDLPGYSSKGSGDRLVTT